MFVPPESVSDCPHLTNFIELGLLETLLGTENFPKTFEGKVLKNEASEKDSALYTVNV